MESTPTPSQRTSPKRKLAAILSADVVGYSRLMGEDEEATVATLTAYRRVFAEHIAEHGGRVVDSPGDAILAEFPSAVEAVNCAVDIQRELAGRNASAPEHRRMRFRVGVNLGDVTEQEGALYGDGVNIAARMESLADAGGICVSGTVYDHVEGKSPVQFKFTGEHSVKNVAKPVRAYRALLAVPGDQLIGPIPKRVKYRAAVILWLLGAAAAITATAWYAFQLTGHNGVDRQTASSTTSSSGFQLSAEPSIAVLPFSNMSGDPKQDYLADGITEDLITALSKIRRLTVIARASTFQYKGKAVDMRQIGRDLGVGNVLQGSVRKDGNIIRVTAQLINATTGAHVWSDRYDRPLKDIFTVQDEITHGLVAALDVELIEGEQARVWRKTTKNVEAYEYFMRGREQLSRYTKEDEALARASFERAIELDPSFALAYSHLASFHLLQVIQGFSENPPHDIERAFALQRKGVELDDTQGYSVVQLGRIHMQIGELDKALEYGKQAVALEPSGATTNAIYAHMLEAAGRPAEALTYVNKALRLAPIPEAWIPWLQGNCLKQLGHYDEAIAAYQRSIALAPRYLWPRVFIVDAYMAAGKEEEAKSKAQELLQIEPSFSVDEFLGIYVWYRDPSLLKGYAANLRKAGLR